MKITTQTQLSNLAFDFLDEVAVFPTKTFSVDVKVSAIATIEIEADSKEEAINDAEEYFYEHWLEYICDKELLGFITFQEVLNASANNPAAREAVDIATVIAFVNDFAAAFEAEKINDDVRSVKEV